MFNFFSSSSSELDKGIALMRNQEYGQARDYFRDLVEKNINVPEAYFNLGKCYFKLDRLAEAKACFHEALNLKSSPEIVTGILEITNWYLLCSYHYFNSWPEFSPDGTKLAFASARRDTNGDGRVNVQDLSGIYIIDLTTMEERCVVPDQFYSYQPTFSPDGTRLTYLSVRAAAANTLAGPRPNPGLYLMNLENGQETQLLNDSYRTKYQMFSPDGKKIIFSCWRPGDKNSGIYALDIETLKMETLVSGFYENTFPSIASTGDKIVFSSWQRDTNGDGRIDFHDNSGICLKYLLGGGGELVIAKDEFNNTFPSFSPDGNRVVYLSVRRDTNKDGKIDSLDNPGIFLFDLARKKEYCIVDDNSFNKFPGFVPNSNKIAFLSNWRRERRDDDKEAKDFFENKGIYTVDFVSHDIQQIMSDKYYGSRSPVVSPTGEWVAYVSWRKDTNRGLYLANLTRQPTAEELHAWIDNNF